MSAQHRGVFEDVLILDVSCASRFPPAACLKQMLKGKTEKQKLGQKLEEIHSKTFKSSNRAFICKVSSLWETLFWMIEVSARSSSLGRNEILISS